jgi:PIN domain nuclease of toxin-antitoxin system
MQADARLGKPVVAALDAFRPDDRPSVCAISLWEVAMLVNLGRLDLGESLRSWLDAAGRRADSTYAAEYPGHCQ